MPRRDAMTQDEEASQRAQMLARSELMGVDDYSMFCHYENALNQADRDIFQQDLPRGCRKRVSQCDVFNEAVELLTDVDRMSNPTGSEKNIKTRIVNNMPKLWPMLKRYATEPSELTNMAIRHDCGMYFFDDYLLHDANGQTLGKVINGEWVPTAWANPDNPMDLSITRSIARDRRVRDRSLDQVDRDTIAGNQLTTLYDDNTQAMSSSRICNDAHAYLTSIQPYIDEYNQIMSSPASPSSKSIEELAEIAKHATNLHILCNFATDQERKRRNIPEMNYYLRFVRQTPPHKQEGEDIRAFFNRFRKFTECKILQPPKPDLPHVVVPSYKREIYEYNGELRSYAVPVFENARYAYLWIDNPVLRQLLRTTASRSDRELQTFESNAVKYQLDPIRQMFLAIHDDLAQNSTTPICTLPKSFKNAPELRIDACREYDNDTVSDDDADDIPTHRGIHGNVKLIGSRENHASRGLLKFRANHYKFNGVWCNPDDPYARSMAISPLFNGWLINNTSPRLNEKVMKTWTLADVIREIQTPGDDKPHINKQTDDLEQTGSELSLAHRDLYYQTLHKPFWEQMQLADNIPTLVSIRTGKHRLMTSTKAQGTGYHNINIEKTSVLPQSSETEPQCAIGKIIAQPQSTASSFHQCVVAKFNEDVEKRFVLNGLCTTPVQITTRTGYLGYIDGKHQYDGGVDITWAAIPTHQTPIGKMFNYTSDLVHKDLRHFFDRSYAFETHLMDACRENLSISYT